MLAQVFGDHRKIAGQFAAIAEQLLAAARLLEGGFEEPAQWPELSVRIGLVQHQADDACHTIHVAIERKLVLPVDREDIHLLSTLLQRVVDGIGGTARRAVSVRATERQEPAVKVARTLSGAIEHIALGIRNFADSDLVLEQCQAIRQCEDEAEAISSAGVSELFEGEPDPIDVLRWKTVYDQLEETLEACTEVADELESMSLKHDVL